MGIKKMNLKNILASFLMSFSLGLLFYLIAASILVDLPNWALSAEIRGKQIEIVNDILKPFIGLAPSGKLWQLPDYVAVTIVWLMAGLIGGFSGRNKFEGGIGTSLAYIFAASISILSSGSKLVFTQDMVLRIIYFLVIGFISGFYFGYLGKLDSLKIHNFWTQLDQNSHKIELPALCDQCQTEYDSNPIICISCGNKMRNEIEIPSFK